MAQIQFYNNQDSIQTQTDKDGKRCCSAFQHVGCLMYLPKFIHAVSAWQKYWKVYHLLMEQDVHLYCIPPSWAE